MAWREGVGVAKVSPIQSLFIDTESETQTSRGMYSRKKEEKATRMDVSGGATKQKQKTNKVLSKFLKQCAK